MKWRCVSCYTSYVLHFRKDTYGCVTRFLPGVSEYCSTYRNKTRLIDPHNNICQIYSAFRDSFNYREMARPTFVLINFTRFKRLYSYRLFHMKRESMITLFGAYPKFGKMSLQHVAQMSWNKNDVDNWGQ